MASTRKLLIEFGDGGSPEDFAFNCSINTNREFTLSATMTEWTEPSCVDPDAPSWQRRAVDVLSGGITGAGTTDPISYGALRDMFLAGEAVNMRVKLDIPLASGGGHFAGAFIISSLGTAKEGKGVVTSTIELQSDGAITWVDAAA